MLARCLAFLHGAGCQAVFVGTHLYAIGFVARVVLHGGGAAGSSDLASSAIVDAALLAGLALQHGLVAQPGFAAWFAGRGGAAGDDRVYLFASSRALIAVFAFWRPLDVDVWTMTDPAAVAALDALRVVGASLVVTAIVFINRRQAFGLRQAGIYLAWTFASPAALRPRGPYRVIRHPLYAGVLLVAWATPSMNAAHLLCALVATAYLIVAMRLEERTLAAMLGTAYRRYRDQVPMLVPSVASLRGRLSR